MEKAGRFTVCYTNTPKYPEINVRHVFPLSTSHKSHLQMRLNSRFIEQSSMHALQLSSMWNMLLLCSLLIEKTS